MTNGQITKKIMQEMQDGHVSEVTADRVEALLMSFHMSSKFLVYDKDLKYLPEDKKMFLLELCEMMDKRKWEDAVLQFMSLGMTRPEAEEVVELPFGRYEG